MFSLVLFLCAAPPSASDAARSRVLVLDLQAVGVSEGEAALLRDAIASRLARTPNIEVLSSGEVKKLIEVEETRQLAGCDPSSSSCLAELAGALGAEYIVTGNVGKLGESMVMNLSLVSGASAQAVGRATVDAPGLDSLLQKINPEVDRMAAAIHGGAPPPPAATGPNLVLLSGVGLTVVGAAAIIGGAIWTGILEGTLGNPKSPPADKASALEQRFGALGVLAGGVVLSGAGAALLTLALTSEGT